MVIRILIADDHGVLRAGLRALLNSEPDLGVVGEAADGHEAIRLAKALQPDVVLMDISMPDLVGIEVTRQLVASQPGVHVLILTVHEDKALLREAMRAGASGYIVKRAVGSELVNAIRAVVRGDLYVHPAMIRALLPSEDTRVIGEPGAAESLTAREIDVLRLIATGHTNRQIAERLILSMRTVESHRAKLMGKLGLHSRVELVRYAAAHGLLEPGAS
jgi:two-component system response regulator NreC